MIKHIILALTMLASSAFATEKIVIANAQGPQQTMTPQFLRIVDEANAIQSQYQFITEFKQGAFESIAIKHMLADPQRRLGTITNAFVESMDRGFVKEDSIVPVFSFGDVCWIIISTGATAGQGLGGLAKGRSTEIISGGPGPGTATHLTALEVGKRYNLPVKYIPFKGNYEAFINMVGDDQGVNFISERAANYFQFRERNSKLTPLAASCSRRHPQLPNVPTLAEQGIEAPYVWNFLIASSEMNADRRKEIEDIFTRATQQVGKDTTLLLSDMQSPIFFGIKSADHYRASIDYIKRARKKWQSVIRAN
jgi:tripartite-type tricarboxylate transporter receptor subunit TctC